MKYSAYHILCLVVSSGLTFSGAIVQYAYADELKVVATISTFADIASQVGGKFVNATSIASPQFNAHFIEPRPTDVLRVKRADLFIHAGLDLELWKGPLVNAAGRAEVRPGGERELDLSSAVKLLELPTGSISRSQGDIHLYGNPHYWLDPDNGLAIGKLIANKLSSIDPAHAVYYSQNFEIFSSKLKAKMLEWIKDAQKHRGAELIAYHNEWVYLTNYLGLEVRYFLEPKPGIPPGPKHIEFLSKRISEREISGIVQASFYPKTASVQVAERTKTSVKILCQNVQELEPCSDYVTMLDYNIREIMELLNHE